MQRLLSYQGKALNLLCLNGHGVQRVHYMVLKSERKRKTDKAPWTTERSHKYVLGCACQRKAAA